MAKEIMDTLKSKYGSDFSLTLKNDESRLDLSNFSVLLRELGASAPSNQSEMNITQMATNRDSGFSVVTQDIFNQLDSSSQRAYNNAVLLGDMPMIQGVDHTMLMDYPVQSIGANVYNDWSRTDVRPEEIDGGIAGRVSNDGGVAVYQNNPNAAPFRRILYGRSKIPANIPFGIYQDDSNNATDDFLFIGYILAEGKLSTLLEVYVDGVKAYNANGTYNNAPNLVNFSDFLEVAFRNGTIGQAALGVIHNDDGTVDANAQLNNIAAAAVSLRYGEQFFTGVPSIWFDARRVLPFDPAFSSENLANGENPVAVLYDYLTSTRYGVGLDIALLDTDSFATAYSVCNDFVASQRRYTFNGIITQDGDHQSHILEILKTFDGELFPSNGKLKVKAGKYVAPNTNYNITETDLLQKPQISFTRIGADLYNTVRGTFIDEAEKWQPVDYPEIKSDAYISDDGELLETSFDLPYCTNALEAQRRAKIELLKSRNKISVTVELPLKFSELDIGDLVNFSYEKWSFVDKLFEVASMDLLLNDPLNLRLAVTLQEARSDCWDFNANEEISTDSLKQPVYFNPRNVAAPTNTQIASSATINEDKQYEYLVDASWTLPFNPYYSYTGANLQYEPVLNSNSWFNVRTEVLFGDDAVTFRTPHVDLRHRVELTNYSNIGWRSDRVLTGAVLVSRDISPPSAISAVNAESLYNKVILRWDAPLDLDLAGYRIYVYNGVASDNPTQPTLPDFEIDKSDAFIHSVPRGEETHRFYWITPVDISGNEGDAITTGAVSLVTESTRYNAGQLYYVADDDDPANEPPEFTEAQKNAMTFDFNTGEWSTLPTGWSSSQPTVTAEDGKVIYSLNYAVRELDGPAGQQVVNTERPYPFLKFTGLVTFASLNTELADPLSTQITTIDGAKITTGVLSADRIEAGSVTASKLFLNGSMLEATSSDQLQVAEGGVGTLQVTKNAISSYKIYDRATTTIHTLLDSTTNPGADDYYDNNSIYPYSFLRSGGDTPEMPSYWRSSRQYTYFNAGDKRSYDATNLYKSSALREWVDTGFTMAFQVYLEPWSGAMGGTSSVYPQLFPTDFYFNFEVDVGYLTLSSDGRDRLGIEYGQHLNFIVLQTLEYDRVIQHDKPDTRSVTMPVFFRPTDGLLMKREWDASDPLNNNTSLGNYVYWPAIRVRWAGFYAKNFTQDEYYDTVIFHKVPYIAVTDIKR